MPGEAENERMKETVEKTIHFSVDDVFDIFRALSEEQFSSAFQEPRLRFFLKLHRLYGCNFSCYCFYEANGKTLEAFTLPEAYLKEIKEASSWLKWGFHGKNRESNYGSLKFTSYPLTPDYETAFTEGDRVLRKLRGWFGNSAIDEVPRIHFCAGTENTCRALKDLGMRGFLAADDDRLNYYLDSSQNRELLQKGRFLDEKTGLLFVQTDLRLERMEQDSESSLMERYFSPAGKAHLEIMTHERYLEEEKIQSGFEKFASLAKKQDFKWNFE